MDLTEPQTVGFNTLNRATGAAALGSITVPTVVGSGTMMAAERHAAHREIASWRQLKMWLDGESLQSAVTVKLIGVHEGHSLLVTAPDESQLYLREGRLYRFRSFSGEYVYEFVSPLVKVCQAPFPYLHIAWAGERQVERRNLRAARRVRTDLQCMVYPGQQSSGRFAKGVIHDLSTAGAAILLQDELSVFYDEVRVVFRVQVAEQEILIEARARAVRKPEPGASDPTLGVAFVGLGDNERLALHAFVNSMLVRELEMPLYA
jgi:c-di-GMP-binding flagellar brake protein YcgR